VRSLRRRGVKGLAGDNRRSFADRAVMRLKGCRERALFQRLAAALGQGILTLIKAARTPLPTVTRGLGDCGTTPGLIDRFYLVRRTIIWRPSRGRSVIV
jgi:hypothetical protein